MATRYLEKFTSSDGSTTVYTFPLARYEYEPSTSLRVARSTIVGASYAFDQVTGTALREVGKEAVRFVVHDPASANVEAAIDEARSELLSIGKGKLWTLDSGGTRRWCWARLVAMPSMIIGVKRELIVPMELDFERYSDWFASSLTTPTAETVTASPDTFTITNPGNLPVRLLTIRIRSNSAAGFTNPKIENLTAVDGILYTFETARDAASANDEVKLDTEEPSVGYSTNDGGAYADDFAQIVIPTLHAPLAFALAPGNNSIRATIDGTENANIEFSFHAAYA